MKKHRSFKPEQKARAVLQVLTGQKSAAQICRELQISGQQQEGERREVTFLAALWRLWWRLLIVFFDPSD